MDSNKPGDPNASEALAYIVKSLDKNDAWKDKVDDRLLSIDKTLVKQSTILEEHIKRTSAAEERLDLLETHLEPLKKESNMVHGALKLMGIGSGLIGFVAGVLKILKILNLL
jgi:hypothetical protein